MEFRLATCIVAAALAIPAYAQDIEFEIQILQNEVQIGPPRLIAAPVITTKSGELGSVHVGGIVPIGNAFMTVGIQLNVTATTKEGAIQIELELAHHKANGAAGATQVSTAKSQMAETIQSGQRIRLELKDDPQVRRWAEIVVRPK